MFGPQRRVGVVGDQDGEVEPEPEPLAQRFVPPGQVRGEAHPGAGGVDEAGRSDPDRADVVPSPETLDRVHDQTLHDVRRRGPDRGVTVLAVDHPTVVTDHPGDDLGATDVDPH